MTLPYFCAATSRLRNGRHKCLSSPATRGLAFDNSSRPSPSISVRQRSGGPGRSGCADRPFLIRLVLALGTACMRPDISAGGNRDGAGGCHTAFTSAGSPGLTPGRTDGRWYDTKYCPSDWITISTWLGTMPFNRAGLLTWQPAGGG